jgi:hypothetical protein
MHKASSPAQVSNNEKNRLYQSALLSTGNAHLSYLGVRDPGADCKLDERKQGNGSAQLVSPDRLVTAHHVISNAGLSLFTIRFDNSNPDGFWYADADYNKADEENPLLANRLWQIGLESWAINSNTHREVTRDFIREWKAVVDLDGYDSFNNPIDSQPFTSNFNIRRDISFIRVKELDNPNFTDAGDPASTPFHIKSGGFRLRYPGLFFNQVENDSIERKVGESKIIDLLNKANNSYTHLQLLSSPPWFDSSMAQNGGYAATACVSGFTDKASAPCAQHEFCLESNPVSSNYTACIKTTLDSVAGSSGGVMLMPTPLYSEVSYQASLILPHCLWLSLLPTTPNKHFVAQKEGQSRELGIISLLLYRVITSKLRRPQWQH